MSRIAKAPVLIPSGVEVKLEANSITVKGNSASLTQFLHPTVEVKQEGSELTFTPKEGGRIAHAMSGTMRALVNNMVFGITQGFEKKLQLNGVGYRAKAVGKSVNLTLGFSHPIDYVLPAGVSAETPTNTEIVLKSADKQLLGQAAAEIRAFRPPEPYKGKGVRYADEHVRRKEAKKK
ncbi:MAG: 50S ribosomal protein L6 [Gallionellaceae bacterium]